MKEQIQQRDEITRVILGHSLMVMIYLVGLGVLFLLAFPTYADAWTIEWVDCSKTFDYMTDRNLTLDGEGHPYIAYGGDHLYYAHYNGTGWQTEVVDDSPGVGYFTSIALDASNYPHISYCDYAKVTATTPTVTSSTLTTTGLPGKLRRSIARGTLVGTPRSPSMRVIIPTSVTATSPAVTSSTRITPQRPDDRSRQDPQPDRQVGCCDVHRLIICLGSPPKIQRSFCKGKIDRYGDKKAYLQIPWRQEKSLR